MAVLVTGGAGYVGSAIMERLVAEGESVVCLDNFSTGHRDAVCAGVDVVEGSILDEALVSETLSRFDVDSVVHCAALSIVPESNREPLAYFENNVVGTERVCSAMRARGVGRFVLSSTAAVYGNPATLPIPETHAIAPVNAYGLFKRTAEELLEWCARAYVGFSFVSLRYFNAAGATATHGEDHRPETHLIPIVLEAAAGRRGEVEVFGSDYSTADGTCVRDYIHVEDLADAHVRAIRYLRDGGASDVFNLGAESGHSVLEVIRAAEGVTEKRVPRTMRGRRAGDVHSLVASREKAGRVLGWAPEKSALEQLLEDAWRWRQGHPEGYAR